MMATDVSVSGQPYTVTARSYATPQFITLAPGAPLKVMTVVPNGQLIQTTGLPQLVPTALVEMAISQPTSTLQPQQTSIQVTPQRRVTTASNNNNMLTDVHFQPYQQQLLLHSSLAQPSLLVQFHLYNQLSWK
ncbi:unnamed protein product [Trichobilharzia szidati]|nr:unnamed protein product [Trichobilharzia szidati]